MEEERGHDMAFGENLERIRKAKKVSQKQLGNALGLTQQMISSYEKGFSAPNMEILLQIAEYFNVSLDDLVGFHLEKPDENSIENRFLTYFHTLNSTDQERCLTIVQTILEDREITKDSKKIHKETSR